MRSILKSMLCGALALLVLSQAAFANAPWLVNTPIVQVTKEIYQPLPGPDTILWCWSYYIGPGGARDETYVEESATTADRWRRAFVAAPS